MASGWFNKGLLEVLAGTTNLTSATIKVALLKSTYTPDFDLHDFYDDVSAFEVANTGGYAAGGATLASKAFASDTTNDRATFDAADVTSFTATTIADAQYAVFYRSTGTASTSPLLFLYDNGTPAASSSATFSLLFNSAGVAALAR